MATPELDQFCSAIQNFREAMECDLPLNDFERLSLENYLALLQMTYIEWKLRNVITPQHGRKRAA
jgi:hypothetical protein